jgi:hypothetical protein
MRLLAAFTPAVDIPPYINISQHPNSDVEFTVRGSAVAHPSGKFQVQGPCASIRLTADQFRQLYFDMTQNFRS